MRKPWAKILVWVQIGCERVPLLGQMPTGLTVERNEALRRIWRRVRRTEDEHQVQLCRELDAGFATENYLGPVREDEAFLVDKAKGLFGKDK